MSPRLVAAVVLFGLGAVAESAAVDGIWKTEPRDNGAYLEVRIGPCEDDATARCGVVHAARAGARPDIVGEPILRDMQPDGEGHWTRGEIIRPGEGTAYRSEMTLEDDVLVVKGCAVAGLFCGSQVWERAP